MNNTMRVIARHAGWEVILDVNSLVQIRFGNGVWIYSYPSAYEAIKREVTDPEVRTELLRQWANYMDHKPLEYRQGKVGFEGGSL